MPRYKFEEGNTWGRPPLWAHPEEFAARAGKYFAYCEGEFEEKRKTITDDMTGEEKEVVWKECVRPPERPTITGLALWMGYSSRKNFYEQGNRNEEFRYMVDRCRMVVENIYEEALFSKNYQGAAFALVNMGWFNRSSIETPVMPSDLGGDKDGAIKTFLDGMSTDQLGELFKAALKLPKEGE